jgi:hypothetical protein
MSLGSSEPTPAGNGKKIDRAWEEDGPRAALSDRSMRQPLLVTAALYLSACAPPAPVAPCAPARQAARPPSVVATPVTQVAAAAQAPPEEPALDRSVLSIPLPARTVCKVSGEMPVDGVTLLIGDSLPLADVAGATLAVHIPHEDDIRDRFVVEAELPGVSLRGFADRYGVKLHPTKAAVFEFVVPRAGAELTVRSASDSEIGLFFRVPPPVSLSARLREYDGDDTVDGVLPCDALSLDVKPFDPFVALSAPTGQGVLRGQSVPLVAKPGGQAVGRVLVEHRTDAYVAVLDRKKGWAEVAYPTEQAVAVGWVRERHLLPSTPELSFAEEAPGTDSSSADGAPRRIMICAHAVPFRGKVGKREVTVGIVHPNQVIPIVITGVGRRRIDLANHGLTLHEDAELWVDDADVRSCKEQGP